jgi:hypothetical protein
MIVLLSIVGYLAVAVVVGRFIGQSVYREGGFYTRSRVKAGDRNGALQYATWHGLFWPVVLYLVVGGALIVCIVWLSKKAAPAAARIFIGKKMLDKTSEND